MDTKQLMDMMMWWIGLSVTGFLVLAGWMWWLVNQLGKKVTYEWIENQFKKDMNEEIGKVTKVLGEIRDALIGDLKEEGLLSRTRKIEERCKAFHKDKE